MELALLEFNLFLFLIFSYKKIRHGLHILQLENYYNDRYFVWMQKNAKTVFNFKVIGLLVISSIINFINLKIGLIVNLLAYAVLIFSTKKKKEKKAFVVTSRIRRMYMTGLVIFGGLAILANIFDTKIMMSVINLVGFIAYTLVYFLNFINKPIEKSIRRGFCNKAKKKLKSNPNLKVVGITGSFGKTSTKYIVNTILSQKYNTLMTPESYNTTMGVVRTINEKLSSTHQLFICEMGAKYIGDIKEICDIVEPDYGILTAIGPQHLDTFKSLDNIRKTKLELVDSLPSENGLAFVNWEDENIRSSKITKNTVKFGLSSEADYYAEDIEIDEKGSNFNVKMPNGDSIKIKTKLLGKLNVLNIVGAVAIADKLGLSKEEIKTGVKYIRPVPHRLNLKQNPNGSIIIDDAYNSNVKGATMALEVLGSFKNRKRILITPGIVELGDKANEYNKNLGKVAANNCDFIILVGAKQAVPILEGALSENFPQDNVYTAKNLDDALNKMNTIIDIKSVVLLENDLPDNYL